MDYFTDLLLERPYSDSPHKIYILAHILGVIYMFAGLAVICDDYFVSALEEMCDRWEIDEDVAGATFMAAGGSAPELFTSIMGVFVAESDVGFGTIVGSAVFNVLFVIALCALFAKEVLELTWWPLFRDCTYYIISLIVLAAFVKNQEVEGYEAVILFMMYIGYVTIMKFNVRLRTRVESYLNARKGLVQPDDIPQGEIVSAKEPHLAVMLSPKAQYMVLRDIRGAALRTILTKRLSLVGRDLESMHMAAIQANSGKAKIKAAAKFIMHQRSVITPDIMAAAEEKGGATGGAPGGAAGSGASMPGPPMAPAPAAKGPPEPPATAAAGGGDDDDDDGGPFDWPGSKREQAVFLFTLPIVAVLYVSIPNCKYDKWKDYFVVTFGLSLVWIAIFSYLMVWWCTVAGEVFGIPPVVMGLTFLAAGTSIPDLLSSVIVARNGYGDMAVSSSIGSNIFDILVGLPVPWMLKTLVVEPGTIVTINSGYIVINVVTLLGMVFAVIVSIMWCGWKLDRKLGYIMFVLYFVFIAESVYLEQVQP